MPDTARAAMAKVHNRIAVEIAARKPTAEGSPARRGIDQ